MRDGTRVVRAGLPEAKQGEPFLPGPTFASAYHLAGDPSTTPFGYGRLANPTWGRFEEALGDLEGGTAVAFASGMAAVAAVLGSTLKAGDLIVIPSDGYYTSRVLAEGFLKDWGMRTRLVPTAGDEALEALDGAALLLLETPSNPGLDVCDVAALTATAHERGVLVAVDNTTSTPLGQRPLELGADFSLASDTKALTGHSDLVLGHVAAREPAHADRVRAWRTQVGAIPGPMEAWLAHRSLATLDVRLERACANALRVAELLSERPEVLSVRYPGLPGDPSHEIARRQMRRFGTVVSFTLRDRGTAERFLASAELVFEATSFGSVHTTAERRGRWGGDAVPAGFIRMSVGCEDADDLCEDIAQALAAAAA